MSDIKLFNKWDYDNLQVNDLGLQRYISLKPVVLPHTGGRHEHRRFGKSEVPIVERFVNRLTSVGLAKGKGGKHIKMCVATGKKQTAITIVKNAFEIINLKTGKNPIQVLIDAVINSAPREDTTRISYGGVVYHQSVDMSPQRRVDIALRFLAQGALKASKKNSSTIEECVADELIAAAENNPKSYAVSRKEERERVAAAAR
ncbi:MAG: 30S ribosomal protein S7 [Candidatus Odinarchaeota archaeon]